MVTCQRFGLGLGQVREVGVHISRLLGARAALIGSEHQVDPLMEVGSHEFALEGVLQHQHELVRGRRPVRQANRPQPLRRVLQRTQVESTRDSAETPTD